MGEYENIGEGSIVCRTQTTPLIYHTYITVFTHCLVQLLTLPLGRLNLMILKKAFGYHNIARSLNQVLKKGMVFVKQKTCKKIGENSISMTLQISY